jgi:hypothetical protein
MRYLLVSFLRKRAGQIDEMVSVTKRVRTSDMESTNVILDFAEKKVVKCLIEGKEHDTTFDKMRDYYNRIYPNLVGQLEKEAGIEKDRAKLEAKLAPTKKK